MQPPRNDDAEQAVLGSLMLADFLAGEVYDAMAMLAPEHFFHPRNGHIFAAIQYLHGQGISPTETLVWARLQEVGHPEVGAAYVAELTEHAVTAANVKHHARLVCEASQRRQLIAVLTNALRSAYDESTSVTDLLADASKVVTQLTAEASSKALLTGKDLMRTVVAELERRHKAGGRIDGLSTGYPSLDRLLCGLRPGEMSIIAARPSMGKSALAANIAEHVTLAQGKAVLFFSVEMPATSVGIRLLSSVSSVSGSKFQLASFANHEWAKVTTNSDLVSRSRLYTYDDCGITVADARARAFECRARFGLDMVIVDYLQLMRGNRKSESREREVASISLGLKSLAKELGVPVVVLSQLNRALEARSDKRPMLSDLRESGSLEQDADVVMFVYRDAYYNPRTNVGNESEVIVSKNRNGATGTARLLWNPEYTRFDEAA